MPHAPDVDHNNCAERKADGPDRRIGVVADRQHGVIARAQLKALGLSDREVGYRLAVGRLQLLHRAVYAVGHGRLSKEARWMAAVLAGGGGAALRRRSAGALWGFYAGGTRIEVATPTQRRSRDGIVFHHSNLRPDEVTEHDGIPVTTVPRTIFDLATVLRPRELERALNEAEVLRLWNEVSLIDLLHRYPRRPGATAIRALLAARDQGARITRSELELKFLEFLDSAGLPSPQTNVLVEGLEVDCLWREQRLVLELDGRDFHATRAAFERDRERDRILQVAGWRPVRITWRQLHRSPGRLARDLQRLLDATTLAA